jgi:outer membrane protein OmpA-like peptidoglycan-associated protein
MFRSVDRALGVLAAAALLGAAVLGHPSSAAAADRTLRVADGASPANAAQASEHPYEAQQADTGDAHGLQPVPDEGTDAKRVSVEYWSAYREFLFDYDRAEIRASDRSKISEIASHLAQNPSLRLGLDGSPDPNGNGLRDRVLTERRVGAVRDALIRAGVPASKIEVGEFADPKLRRDRQVEVVLRNAR